jgi:lipoprotein-releasing system permease protein
MYKVLLVWRYFCKRRVAWVAVGAVGVIVMMVVVVLNVMAGLLDETREQNHRWSGDVVLSRASLVGFGYYEEFIKELGTVSEVAGATAVVRSFGLTDFGSGQIYGVKLDEYCSVTDFGETLRIQKDARRVSFLVPRRGGGEALSEEQRQRGHIVGQFSNAESRNFNITVFGISSRGALVGSGLGQTQEFWNVDVSASGLVDVDMSAIYVDFDVLQKLCGMDGVDGQPARVNEIRVKLADGVDLKQGQNNVKKKWVDFLGRYGEKDSGHLLTDVQVEDWTRFRRSFIAPIESEKNMMTLVFGLMSLVAVFVIFAIFYMIVVEKIKDLGIVRSIGASRWGLGQIFLGFGLLIGLIGSMIGGVVGALIVIFSNEIEAGLGVKIWDPDIYAIEQIPNQVFVGQTLWIGVFAVAAALLGAVIPAWRAGRLEVVEALRVE